MNGTTRSITADSSIVWQSPANAGEWLRAGCWVWNARRMATAPYVFGIYLGAFLAFGGILQLVMLGEGTLVVGMGLLLGLLSVGVPAALLTGWGCLMVPRITLDTD